MSPWRRLLHNLARRRQKGRDRRDERGRFAQWFLLAGLRGRDAWSNPDPAGLTPLYPPEDAFWADPFAWSGEGPTGGLLRGVFLPHTVSGASAPWSLASGSMGKSALWVP